MSNHPKVTVKSRTEWRAWLQENHGQSESIWLVTCKKGSADHLLYNDIVEEALCFGWVDSLPRALDDARTMLRVSPRRPQSAWSKANKERAERMIAAGQMAEAGLVMIERAKANGAWNKLDAVEALTLPGDLAEALAAQPPARANFDGFPRSVKRGILEWIEQAKRPQTRAKRVLETATLAARNERANQWPRER